MIAVIGLEQLHNHGRGDVIRQIGADYDLHPRKFILNQLVQVKLEHVGIYNFYIVILRKRFTEYGDEPFVELDRDNLVRKLTKLVCKHADSRADFNYADSLACSRKLSHSGANGRIYQEVLTERL